MKLWKRAGGLWSSLVGFVFSLAGLAQPGAAALPPEGTDRSGVEPKNRLAQPEPGGSKIRSVSFEGPNGTKSRGAIAMQPDGGVRGLIVHEPKKSEKGKDLKNKRDILYPESRSPRTAPKPSDDKKRAFIVPHSQPNKALIVEPPAKGKTPLIMNQPQADPAKGKVPEKAPALDRQSYEPEIHDPLALTDEQKDSLVFGSRDRAWLLNAEGLLERRLPEGVRVVVREQGRVEVFDAEGRLRSVFHDARAGKLEKAVRIAERMKRTAEALSAEGKA